MEDEVLAAFVPKDKNFEGEIIISLPDFEQTMIYTDSFGVKIDDKGEVSFANSEIAAMAAMSKNVAKHVREVNLVNKKTGQKIDSFKLLSIFCKPIMSELIGLFIKGFEPGKNLKLL